MTNEQIEKARAMRAGGSSWRAIGIEFGTSGKTVRMAVDREFAEAQNSKIRSPSWRGLTGSYDLVSSEDIAKMRAQIPDHRRDLTAYTFGDPVFEHSALYAKRQELS